MGSESRIGQLFASLPLSNLPLELVLSTFETYCTPLFMYGLPLWLNKTSNSSLAELDSMFTKFLKRYLCAKPWTKNAIVYHLTDTIPFSKYLAAKAPHSTKSFTFPSCLSGLQLSFLTTKIQNENYNPIPDIPTSFWLSKTFSSLPASVFYRKNLVSEILDANHVLICKNTKFHPYPQDDCICCNCGEQAHPYHMRYCKNLLIDHSH